MSAVCFVSDTASVVAAPRSTVRCGDELLRQLAVRCVVKWLTLVCVRSVVQVLRCLSATVKPRGAYTLRCVPRFAASTPLSMVVYRFGDAGPLERWTRPKIKGTRGRPGREACVGWGEGKTSEGRKPMGGTSMKQGWADTSGAKRQEVEKT